MTCTKLAKVRDLLDAYIFSNGSIRLYMLAYLNLTTFALLTINEVNWDDTAEFTVTRASMILAYVFFVLAVLMPLVIFVHFFRHRQRWTDSDFMLRYDTFF